MNATYGSVTYAIVAYGPVGPKPGSTAPVPAAGRACLTPWPRSASATRSPSSPSYVPGARPDGTLTEKLSSNENPFPPLTGVVAAVSDAAADLNRYPDLAATQLVTELASRFQVEPEQVVVGNGSVALLETILTALLEPGDEVVYAWRSFEAYPIAVAIAGGTAVPVPLTEGERHDLPAMAAAVTDRTKAVILCSPNNPTGPALRDAEVRALLAELPRGCPRAHRRGLHRVRPHG